jgi:hypothetical protein
MAADGAGASDAFINCFVQTIENFAPLPIFSSNSPFTGLNGICGNFSSVSYTDKIQLK